MTAALNESFVVPDHTRVAQRQASDPRASAWVSANAGSGKTKVLTDRVVRLLLDDAPPGRILCLTFTKAAAAHMAVKTFERLGRWVTMEEDALVAELAELEGEPPSRAKLRRARCLFAHAVETPGGLKIETIHAFCERLLHLVPFEANVPARFVVLDEGQSRELATGAIEAVIAQASAEPGSALGLALEAASLSATPEGLRKALGEALEKRAFLARRDGVAPAFRLLRGKLKLGPAETASDLLTCILDEGIPPAEWPGLAAELERGKANDVKRAACLRRTAAAEDAVSRWESYAEVFFDSKDEPRSATSIVTKGMPDALRERLLAEQARLIPLRGRLLGAEALERSEALFALAAAARERIETDKQRLGALDFDDLIARTLALLQRGEAAWLLYKLDRGIDHVLVDEAQDTNPQQWEILAKLTEEFTAGHGARGRQVRTFFAVGDPKQSIFSFQGAEPRWFEQSRRAWGRRHADASLPFREVPLTLSFRSTASVLAAVDATFSAAAHLRGLSFEPDPVRTVHETARPGAPGAVELWTVATKDEEAEPDAFGEPARREEEAAPAVRTGAAVAAAVRRWTTQGDEAGRVYAPGEILVLVRRRNAAFEAVIRGLRQAGVPVAGQDRLDVAAHIAVQDVVAAGRSALMPEDDLTLAAALKSPLVGLTDDDLVRIAAPRGPAEPLAAALGRLAEAGDAAAAKGREALARWRALARSGGPFAFFAALLGPEGARARLVRRLGPEAGDALDVFLCAAHQAEAGPDAPSLAGFLEPYASGGAEGRTVKRDLEGGRDEVRVMTVHGAKGLEAPLVVVIDGCEVRNPHPPALVDVALDVPGGALSVPVWSPRRGLDCPLVAEARGALAEREREEHNRLLYVAMTRAKDRLVIAPYVNATAGAPETAWCEMVRRSLLQAAVGDLVHETVPDSSVDLWRGGTVATRAPRDAASAAAAALFEAPDWLFRPAPPEREPLPPLRPSSALAAADPPPRPAARPPAPGARLKGTLVHALLESLPGLAPEHRARAASAFVRARAGALPADWQERVTREALGVLDRPDLAPLFGPGSRAEVPIAGSLWIGPLRAPVAGQIDRLALLPDRILLADFKTGRPPEDGEPLPAPYAGQLALYRALLAEIFPTHPLRAYLIWTAGPLVREVPGPELDAALARIQAG